MLRRIPMLMSFPNPGTERHTLAMDRPTACQPCRIPSPGHPEAAGFVNLIPFALALLLGPGIEAFAERERILLPSGEVVIGRVLQEEDQSLLVQSETLGQVKVPRQGAQRRILALDSAEPATIAPGWSRRDPPQEGAAGKLPASTPKTDEAPDPPADPSPGIELEPEEKAAWERKVELGVSMQESRKSVSAYSVHAQASIERVKGDSFLRLRGRYLFGVQNAERSTDKFEAGAQFRQHFFGRINIRNDFLYSFDRLKDLSNQFENTLGLEYVLTRGPRLQYAFSPGFAFQYAEPELAENGWELLGNLNHRLVYQFTDSISLNHNASYHFTPNDWNDHRLRLNAALVAGIAFNLTVSLRYEYEWESILPVSTGRSDHRLYTILSYLY